MKKLNQDQLRNIGGGNAVYRYYFVQYLNQPWYGYSTHAPIRINGHYTAAPVQWRSPYRACGYDGYSWCRVG